MRVEQISKSKALKQFKRGKTIYVLPNALPFENPYIIPMTVRRQNGQIAANIEKDFNNFIKDYSRVSCCKEFGKGVSYYIAEDDLYMAEDNWNSIKNVNESRKRNQTNISIEILKAENYKVEINICEKILNQYDGSVDTVTSMRRLTYTEFAILFIDNAVHILDKTISKLNTTEFIDEYNFIRLNMKPVF